MGSAGFLLVHIYLGFTPSVFMCFLGTDISVNSEGTCFPKYSCPCRNFFTSLSRSQVPDSKLLLSSLRFVWSIFCVVNICFNKGISLYSLELSFPKARGVNECPWLNNAF